MFSRTHRKPNAGRRARAAALVRALKKLLPRAHIALRYGTVWELLVAVVLSAQCTDKKVNEVTEKLFKKYKKLDDYVNADPDAFARDIKPTGFYRAKAKNILASARKVKNEYGGRVPRTMEDITKLPGVARKSANVILGNAYGVVEGIAVDTHVKRLAKRFGLTAHADPIKIEKDLMELLPKKEWFNFTYRLIEYGRQYCAAKRCPPDHPLRRFDAD